MAPLAMAKVRSKAVGSAPAADRAVSGLAEAAQDFERQQQRRGPQPGHQRRLDPSALFGQPAATAIDVDQVFGFAGGRPDRAAEQIAAERQPPDLRQKKRVVAARGDRGFAMSLRQGVVPEHRPSLRPKWSIFGYREGPGGLIAPRLVRAELGPATEHGD